MSLFYQQSSKHQKQFVQISFINTYISMQAEPTLLQPGAEQVETEQENQQNLYDFSHCTRIKKLTTHDIFKFKHEDMSLIVKLFASEALPNYQQEVSYLTRMKHDQVLRIMYHRRALNPISCQPLENSHMIVMKQAVRGDLNDYLPKFGRMSEKMARTLFKQLVDGLSSAAKLKPAIIHPNLQASSILLSQTGQLHICGWSQLVVKDLQTQLQQCVFSCGQILICMLTSFMPFYKKYSNTDAFYKFISEPHIHKFWQQLQKRMSRVDKNFKFSEDLKKLASEIFLKKIKTFEEINEHKWTKGETYSLQDLQKLLEQNEKQKEQKLVIKHKQEIEDDQKRKKILMELSYAPQRSSTIENNQFVKDYQESMIKEEELPIGTCSLKVEGSPAFVVAGLKEFLRQQNGKESVLVRQQFVLSNHKVVKVNNYIIIDLIFSVSLLAQDEQQELIVPVPADSVSLKLKLSFSRNQKQIYAQIQVVQSNFNNYYTTLALRFLEQKINKRRESHFQKVSFQ